MATKVSICNQALGWLGEDSILTIDDNTVGAQLCKANFDHLRDAVLEDKAWTFATKRYTLAPDSTTPEWGYAYRFLIPSEILVIQHASDNDSFPNQSDPNFDYRIENGYLLCDSNVVYIKATKKIEDPALFSAGFVQALATRIAAELAMPITESRAVMELYWALYDKKVGMAAGSDGIQGKSDRLKATRYQRVR